MDSKWQLKRLGSFGNELLTLNYGENIVGRTLTCKIRIYSAIVSRCHCKLTVENNDVYIEDLQSSNGTFVDQVRIFSKTKLVQGSIIGFGICDFTEDKSVEESDQHQYRLIFNIQQPLVTGIDKVDDIFPSEIQKELLITENISSLKIPSADEVINAEMPNHEDIIELDNSSDEDEEAASQIYKSKNEFLDHELITIEDSDSDSEPWYKRLSQGCAKPSSLSQVKNEPEEINIVFDCDNNSIEDKQEKSSNEKNVKLKELKVVEKSGEPAKKKLSRKRSTILIEPLPQSRQISKRKNTSKSESIEKKIHKKSISRNKILTHVDSHITENVKNTSSLQPIPAPRKRVSFANEVSIKVFKIEEGNKMEKTSNARIIGYFPK